jgi:hypothetical protein
MDDILTMSESSDMEMIYLYQSYVRQADKSKNKQTKLNKEMGYISSVDDAKEILEKLFKDS